MHTQRSLFFICALLFASCASAEDDAAKIQKLKDLTLQLENCTKNSQRAIVVFQIEPLKCFEPGAAKALIRLLNSTDQGLSHYASKALAGMGAGVIPLLATEARDTKDKELREECLRALTLCDAVPLQNDTDERLLRDTLMTFWRADGDSAYWSREGLSRFHVICMPALLKELESSDGDRQRDALTVLGNVKGSAQDAIPSLERYFDNPDRKLATLAMHAAARLGKVSDAGLDAVIAQLKSGDTRQRNAAVDVLIANGPACIAKLRPLLVDATLSRPCRMNTLFVLKELHLHAEPCIPELIEVLSDPNPHVVFDAAKVLSALGPKASRACIPLLKAMSAHRSSEGSIERALQSIGPLDVGDLSKALELDGVTNRAILYALKRLGELGKKAVSAEPAVRRLLDSDDPQVHRAALDTLDLIKPAKDADF